MSISEHLLKNSLIFVHYTYLYDFEEYFDERGLFYPFDDCVVGKRVYTSDELLQAIDTHDYVTDPSEFARVVDKFWGASAQYNSNQKVLDFVKSLD